VKRSGKAAKSERLGNARIEYDERDV
jgi:hypothetical protein